MRKLLGLLVVAATCWACHKHYTPKPKAYLALEFPEHHYKRMNLDCPYSFDMNTIARLQPSLEHRDCMFDIVYPKMKGTIYITYEPVHDNLEKLLKDAQKMPLKHTIKADAISGDEYVNPKHHTYGMMYSLSGDAASQAQFYLTDSTSHFITGSLYFRLEPNYDSIYPAGEYLRADMKRIMESLTWKE